jgi:putative transposase
VWSDALVQRCTVHKHRNTLARPPERLQEETSAEHNDMICANAPTETEARNKSFIRKWRLKRSALPTAWTRPEIGCSPSPACPTASRDRHPLPMPSSAARGLKRRIKTQTRLPSAETAAMLFWALLPSGQITTRKVDRWQTLAAKPTVQCIDVAP